MVSILSVESLVRCTLRLNLFEHARVSHGEGIPRQSLRCAGYVQCKCNIHYIAFTLSNVLNLSSYIFTYIVQITSP